MTQEKRMAQENAGYQGEQNQLPDSSGDNGLTFNQKIIAIQSELKAPKNQFNNFGKYKYRSCEDILEGVKPLLSKYGLLQTIRDEVRMIGDRYYIEATVIVSGGENETVCATALAREPENKKGMDDSQITGTASSYARKYALNGMWLIDDTKDSDSDEHEKQVQNANNKDHDEKKWLNATNKDGTLNKNGEYTAQRIFNAEVTWDDVYELVKVSKKDKEAVEKRVYELEDEFKV